VVKREPISKSENFQEMENMDKFDLEHTHKTGKCYKIPVLLAATQLHKPEHSKYMNHGDPSLCTACWDLI
jgi:hypothetical protein